MRRSPGTRRATTAKAVAPPSAITQVAMSAAALSAANHACSRSTTMIAKLTR